MPCARLLSAAVLCLAVAPAARADPGAYSARITVPEVEVRSGPSPQFYATGKLRQGDAVAVVRELGDWLAILPPPDSFNWINTRSVQQTAGPYATVVGDEAEVLIGSRLRNEPPTVRGVKLQKGSQVVVLGKPLAAGDALLLPIQPPPQEVRYVPAEAIKGSTPVQANASPAGAVPGAVPLGAADPLAQAEQAEKSGNLTLALSLYQQVADQARDYDTRVRCYNRIQHLRDALRAALGSPPLPPPAAPDTRMTTSPTAPSPAWSAPGQPGQALSQYGPSRDAPTPVTVAPLAAPVPPPSAPVAATLPGAMAAPAPTAEWSGPGRLYRTSFCIDGQVAYGLESSQGQVLMYVTPQRGLSLEPYVYHNVNVYGLVAYHGALRKHHMTAVQVTPLP